MLTGDEVARYQRQISIFGKKGQEKLKRAKVFVAGAGGLGSPVLAYLNAAGIGRLKVVDSSQYPLFTVHLYLPSSPTAKR